jgi:hypothetical protein
VQVALAHNNSAGAGASIAALDAMASYDVDVVEQLVQSGAWRVDAAPTSTALGTASTYRCTRSQPRPTREHILEQLPATSQMWMLGPVCTHTV